MGYPKLTHSRAPPPRGACPYVHGKHGSSKHLKYASLVGNCPAVGTVPKLKNKYRFLIQR